MKSRLKSCRGAIPIIVAIYYAAIAAAGVFGVVELKKAFAPSKPTASVNAADKAVADALRAAEEAKQAAAALAAKIDDANRAHAAEVAAAKAKSDSVGGFVAGAQMALAGEANPSINVRIAKIMVDDAARAGDPVTAAALQEMGAIVRDLIATNATTSVALQSKEAEIANLKAAAANAKATADQVTEQLNAKSKEVVALTTVTQVQSAAAKGLSDKVAAWANDTESVWDRLKAACWVIALLIATALLIAVKLFGVTKVKDDLVALGEHTKAFIEKTAGPDARAALEKSHEAWIEGDAKLSAAIATTKAKLRL